MTTHRIILDPIHHAQFLAEGRKDPITKEPLVAGMQIVICANDNLAFISDNWQGSCPICHGTETLSQVQESIQLNFTRRVPQSSNVLIAAAEEVVEGSYTQSTSASNRSPCIILFLVMLAVSCVICCIVLIFLLWINNLSGYYPAL